MQLNLVLRLRYFEGKAKLEQIDESLPIAVGGLFAELY